MDIILIVAVATLASGLSTWLIERRRSPDRALRIGIGAGMAILCILGLGFFAEGVAPAEWRNGGFAAGLIAGAVIAAALTGKFDLGTRPRRSN